MLLSRLAMLSWYVVLFETYGASVSYASVFRGSQIIIPAANITLAGALAGDIFITGFSVFLVSLGLPLKLTSSAACYYLLNQRSGFAPTDSLISRLIRCSIESAVPPTAVALVNIVMSNEGPWGDQWFLLPSIMLQHVYACCLLYTVNIRRKVSTKMGGVGNGSTVSPGRGHQISTFLSNAYAYSVTIDRNIICITLTNGQWTKCIQLWLYIN